MKPNYDISKSTSFVKLSISIFHPKWLKYIKKVRIVNATKRQKEFPDIALYEAPDNVITIYRIRSQVDLIKTLLHEYAHAINYALNKDLSHSAKWRSILNQLLIPFKEIHKGKLNGRF